MTEALRRMELIGQMYCHVEAGAVVWTGPITMAWRARWPFEDRHAAVAGAGRPMFPSANHRWTMPATQK